jgi:hypothetical protein
MQCCGVTEQSLLIIFPILTVILGFTLFVQNKGDIFNNQGHITKI